MPSKSGGPYSYRPWSLFRDLTSGYSTASDLIASSGAETTRFEMAFALGVSETELEIEHNMGVVRVEITFYTPDNKKMSDERIADIGPEIINDGTKTIPNPNKWIVRFHKPNQRGYCVVRR